MVEMPSRKAMALCVFTITVSARGNGQIKSAEFALTGGEGRLVLPQFYNPDLKVRSLTTRGRFTSGLGNLQLDTFRVELDGPVVDVVGLVESSGGKVTYLGKISMSGIAIKDFAKFWPDRLKYNARDWIDKNIPGDFGTDAWPKPDDPKEQLQCSYDWMKKLHEGGWVGIGWPKEYGGRAATPIESFIWMEEISRCTTPFSRLNSSCSMMLLSIQSARRSRALVQCSVVVLM